MYWTKDISSVIIGRGNIYEKSLIANDVNGIYVCHLKNLVREVTSSFGVFFGGMYNCVTSMNIVAKIDKPIKFLTYFIDLKHHFGLC